MIPLISHIMKSRIFTRTCQLAGVMFLQRANQGVRTESAICVLAGSNKISAPSNARLTIPVTSSHCEQRRFMWPQFAPDLSISRYLESAPVV